MIVDANNPSPLMQQWNWEIEDRIGSMENPLNGCNRCGTKSPNAWCPQCHPLHFQQPA